MLSIALSGCPIWSDADDDEGPGCYDGCCDDGCQNNYCTSPSQCSGFDEVCGYDNQCHYGSCYDYGCVDGFVCDDTYTCVPEPGQGGGGFGGEGAGGSGPAAVYCGNPDDCGPTQFCAPDGTCHDGDCSIEGCIYGFYCDTLAETPYCARSNPFGCGSDDDCGIDTADRCVNGVCTAPSDQCFDQTQCAGGSVCANGKCTPSCDGGAACPSDYTCEATVSLCSVPAAPCTITNDCGGADRVCVDGACVQRSVDGICNSGSAWVDNGCIPDQAAIFVCAIDGMQDVCSSGSICLHHSCYISCDAPNETACDGLPAFDVCKTVTTPSGDHAVCGSDSNLGDQCDPTNNVECGDGLICVDGYCK
ncbi:MAG: hypothetical protein HOW73_14075 [Polyangiaceae bacterium]|nr:hypothetical protein [Polyangiaceae bacterium]